MLTRVRENIDGPFVNFRAVALYFGVFFLIFRFFGGNGCSYHYKMLAAVEKSSKTYEEILSPLLDGREKEI